MSLFFIIPSLPVNGYNVVFRFRAGCIAVVGFLRMGLAVPATQILEYLVEGNFNPIVGMLSKVT